ncbi:MULTISPECIES: hypothetical protein [Rheinheimera]|uniref:Uncharacterized protein n=1 Tax=Rheinheimera marina TaxID=1774958 RepID=A0ABV9JPC2_9GAMM
MNESLSRQKPCEAIGADPVKMRLSAKILIYVGKSGRKKRKKNYKFLEPLRVTMTFRPVSVCLRPTENGTCLATARNVAQANDFIDEYKMNNRI